MVFTLTGFLLGLKAVTDIGVHNETAIEKTGKWGWDSIECGLKGGGCYPQGSVENIGVVASWLFDSHILLY